MIIVGAGRVGRGLEARAAERGATVPLLVSRGAGWDALENHPGPILVAVRNDDLDAVVDRIPTGRRGELVLVQNGMLRPWLESRGLAGVTRGLLFFAAPSVGAPIQPGGASPFCGPFAPQVVRWFEAMGLEAEDVSPAHFAEVELEKLIWNCAFGLMCEAHDATVEMVVRDHGEQLARLVAELVAVGAPPLGVRLEVAPLVARLRAYSLSIPDYRGAVKEWPYRNGWFVEEARRQGVSTPTHDELLFRVGRA